MTHWFQNRYNHIDCASNHSTDAELRTILQRETSEWRGKIALREILIAWFIQHIWHSVRDLRLPLNVYPSSKITAARVGLFLNLYGFFFFLIWGVGEGVCLGVCVGGGGAQIPPNLQYLIWNSDHCKITCNPTPFAKLR